MIMEYDTLVERVACAQTSLDRLSEISWRVFDSYNQFISGGVCGADPLDMPPLEEVQKIVRRNMIACRLMREAHDVLIDVSLEWDETLDGMLGATKNHEKEK